MNQKQYREICFTSYNIDIEWFKDWTQEKKSIIDYIIVQGEYCKDGKKHIQGYAQFNGQKRMEQIKKFFGDNALHIEKTLGTPTQASNYCKELKNGVWNEYKEYGTIKEKNMGQRTDLIELRELIKDGMSLKEISMNTNDEKILSNIIRYNKPLKELEYNIRQERFKESIKDTFKNIVWRPFQQQILDEIENITDNRKVKWIYDEIGNNGKSYLARYLIATKDIYYITGGKQQDILYGYNGQSIIIYDLARTYADNLEHIYTTIENFKNGQYLSTKYESQQRLFNIPHIIIMANFKPDETKLSKDRWDILSIQSGQSQEEAEEPQQLKSDSNQTCKSDINEIQIISKLNPSIKLKMIINPRDQEVYMDTYKFISSINSYQDINTLQLFPN